MKIKELLENKNTIFEWSAGKPYPDVATLNSFKGKRIEGGEIDIIYQADILYSFFNDLIDTDEEFPVTKDYIDVARTSAVGFLGIISDVEDDFVEVEASGPAFKIKFDPPISGISNGAGDKEFQIVEGIVVLESMWDYWRILD